MTRRLPKNAFMGLGAAGVVARTPARVEAAAAFWRTAFQEVGALDGGTLAHPALALGEKLPDEWFWKLLPDRNHLTAFCPDDFVLKRSGPLVSLREIASAVYPTLKPAGLNAHVAALLAAGTAGLVVPPEVAAVAMVGVRELFDAIRRFRMCHWNGEEFGLPVSELLALYRQEGALCLAPPPESYPHASLIRTHAGAGPRTQDVVLPWDPSCARPGFNLVYTFLEQTDAVRTDASIRFDVLLRSLLTLGGLDTIVQPRLERRDELCQLWQMASSGEPLPSAVASLRDTYSRHMATRIARRVNLVEGKTQRQLLDDLCLGLLRNLLEAGAALLPAEQLLDRVWLSVAALLSAHGFAPTLPWAGTDVHLVADREGMDTYECLRTQVRWYASRRELRTLLAWQDRAAPRPAQATLSPFMTYLRFHCGDVIFVGLLLRVLARFDYLTKAWTSNKAKWGTSFLDAVPPAGLDRTGFVGLDRDLRTHWQGLGHRIAWHHLGLIEALRQRPDVPGWLKSAQPGDPRLVKSAAVVARLVEILDRAHVLDAVSAALEYTPAFWLASHGFTGQLGSDVLVKTHSFQRLRLAYHQAAREAGLE